MGDDVVGRNLTIGGYEVSLNTLGLVLGLEEDFQFGDEQTVGVVLVDQERLSNWVEVVSGSFLGFQNLSLGTNNRGGVGELGDTGRRWSLAVEENTTGNEVSFGETFNLWSCTFWV